MRFDATSRTFQSAPEDAAPTLLAVDDDPLQRRVITKIARQAGFAVVESASVLDASQLLRTRKIDCATIDLSLGAQSGLELLATIANVCRDSYIHRQRTRTGLLASE